MVEATSHSLKRGSLPQLVRHPSKESKAEETHKKGKIITISNKCTPFYSVILSECVFDDLRLNKLVIKTEILQIKCGCLIINF